MAAMNCPRCGAQNTTDDKFCGTCGAALKKDADAKRAANGSQTAAPSRNILFLIAGIVLLGVALALVWALLSPAARPAATVVTRTPTASDLPFSEVKRMEPAAAKAQLDAASALFVDVRGESDYASGHIPGAVLIPLEETETRYTELPRDRTIITYCT